VGKCLTSGRRLLNAHGRLYEIVTGYADGRAEETSDPTATSAFLNPASAADQGQARAIMAPQRKYPDMHFA
jgi:hypothetical protein